MADLVADTLEVNEREGDAEADAVAEFEAEGELELVGELVGVGVAVLDLVLLPEALGDNEDVLDGVAVGVAVGEAELDNETDADADGVALNVGQTNCTGTTAMSADDKPSTPELRHTNSRYTSASSFTRGAYTTTLNSIASPVSTGVYQAGPCTNVVLCENPNILPEDTGTPFTVSA